MNKYLVLIFITGALAGCASPPVAKVPMKNGWNPNEVVWSIGDGTATLTGSAALLTKGGDVKTCATRVVTLTPFSTYSAERIARIYGNTWKGFSDRGDPTLPERYYEATRKDRTTTCDGQGNFIFENLPAGDYFVITGVSWQTPTSYGGLSMQGGVLMIQVKLETGKTKKVVLSP